MQLTALSEFQYNHQPHQASESSDALCHLAQAQTQAEETIAEEHTGLNARKSTTEQIFNLRILCEQDF